MGDVEAFICFISSSIGNANTPHFVASSSQQCTSVTTTSSPSYIRATDGCHMVKAASHPGVLPSPNVPVSDQVTELDYAGSDIFDVSYRYQILKKKN